MGRLFWKFFFFTLLAQLLATVAVGGALWLFNRAHETPVSDIDTSPPAAYIIESAAATLEFGGPRALQSVLKNSWRRRQVFAIDEAGHELLERTIAPAVVEHARALLSQQGQRHVVREVAAPDGHRYLLFMPGGARGMGMARGEGDALPPPLENGEPGMAPPYPGEPGARGPEGGPDGKRGPPPGARNHFFGMGEMHLLPYLTVISAIIGSLIFAALVALYFSKPIRELRSAFNAVASGNLDTRLAPEMGQRRDELADLGRDFDRMSSQLRDLMDGQRRLLHDVSHEMRSPLARLQAAIGLARLRPENVAPSMDRIERECIRMDKLVGELLTLSRVQAGVTKAAEQEIEVDQLLQEIVDDARFEAQAGGGDVELRGAVGQRVRGEPELLRRAIENVLRNAIRHTAPKTTVELEAHSDLKQKELRLTILDHGPGVAPSELHAIFEPFYRGNHAGPPSDGHGLGLAIANRVISTQGGRIRAFNREGGGLGVEIILPLLLTA